MRFLQALAIQVLAILLRESSKDRTCYPEYPPVEVYCNCTSDSEKPSGYSFYWLLVIGTSGLFVGIFIAGGVTWVVSRSHDRDQHRGSRRRGGGVLAVPETG